MPSRKDRETVRQEGKGRGSVLCCCCAEREALRLRNHRNDAAGNR